MRLLTKYTKLVIGKLEGFEKRDYDIQAEGPNFYGE